MIAAFRSVSLRSSLSLVAALALTLAAATGCRGCGEHGPEHVLGLVDPGAAGVFWVPDIAQLSRGADAFVLRATRKAGPGLSKTMRDRLREQLGFDPLIADDWAKAGIDPSAGAVVFTEGASPAPLLAVGVADFGVFEKAIPILIERADGANRTSTETFAGRTVNSIGRPFGDETIPVLSWARVGRYAIAANAQGIESLKAALTRLSGPAPALGLDADADWKRLVPKVPPGELVARVRGTAGKMVSESVPLIADAVGSVHLGAEGVNADVFIATGPSPLEAALAATPALPLAANIENDAVIVALTRAARPESVVALRALPYFAAAIDRSEQPIKSSTGVDPETEALPLFAGPMTLSVHLNDLSSAPQRLQSRSIAALLELVHVSVTAELKDAKGMIDLLGRSMTALKGQGVPVRKRALKIGEGAAARDAIIFEPDKPTPLIGWAVLGNTYVYCAGNGRLERTLKALAAGPSNLPAVLEPSVAGRLAQENGTSVVLARPGLAIDAAVAAKAAGPLTVMLGSLAEVVKAIGDIAVGLHAESDGVRLRLRQTIQ